MPQTRLLRAFILAGLFFMLVPGTLVGVWSLIAASGQRSIAAVSPAWMQGHGHAQVFGWIGTFIIGIGLFSITAPRPGYRPPVARGWACGLLWVSGVLLRWAVAAYGDPGSAIAPLASIWRPLLAASGLLELGGVALFLTLVAGHRPASGGGPVLWVRMVAVATLGLFATIAMNAVLCLWFANSGTSPAVPHLVNQRFLVLATWGFLAPFVWGFSAHWLPVFLGLPAPRPRLIVAGLAANTAGVVSALTGLTGAAVWLLLAGALTMTAAIGVLRRSEQPPKTRGVHASFVIFVRAAYVWLVVAALLGIAAFQWDSSGGVWGASRHAFTVGFITSMVFAVGQRVLPQFAASRPLWSTVLMRDGLLFLSAGCLMRVVSEIVAYQQGAAWAWAMLPVSAIFELTAICTFALNILMSLRRAEPVGDARLEFSRAD